MTTYRRRALPAGLPRMSLAARQWHAQAASHMNTRHPGGEAGEVPAPGGATP